ncbi:RNA polymerase sigma factor [Rugosimonospora africana]|uniref:RNA polymerase sigma factor n=1 Tax=Rugosimonospora africana TaxID=556532 RepID=A0A8J3QT95_9ACTN|nr:sigma-70 family RNA polymerase sigma factor [Rugosimonospora africana]GIH16624.1 RNA polymerase sigma24 factor [Rugosimonospora africana]
MDNNGLIMAVARGDDAALRELFVRHAPWIAARLHAVLPAADVEDVIQETFLGVWRGAAGYRADGAGAWLWGIARRQAALWLRRRGRNEAVLASLPTDDLAHTADPADAAVDRLDLAEAVRALGAEGSPHRETWRLIYVEERTVAEAAEAMGVPAGTVKSRAHHARALLRAALRRGPAAEEG